MEYELTNIITVVKENQRAVINPEVNVVLTCAYCNKEIRDDAFKVKEGDKEYCLLPGVPEEHGAEDRQP